MNTSMNSIKSKFNFKPKNSKSMKIKKNFKIAAIAIIAAVAFSACSDDDDGNPEPVNESEVITDVTLTFTGEDGSSEIYTFKGPQYRGDNYVDPVIDLTSNEVYNVEANFFDRSNPDDPETITSEVMEESDAHFLEYDFNGVDIELTRTDGEMSTDSDGVQIGLSTEWVAQSASEGQVTVTLIHEASSKDTSNPNGDHEGGETDAMVDFGLNVQ